MPGSPGALRSLLLPWLVALGAPLAGCGSGPEADAEATGDTTETGQPSCELVTLDLTDREHLLTEECTLGDVLDLLGEFEGSWIWAEDLDASLFMSDPPGGQVAVHLDFQPSEARAPPPERGCAPTLFVRGTYELATADAFVEASGEAQMNLALFNGTLTIFEPIEPTWSDFQLEDDPPVDPPADGLDLVVYAEAINTDKSGKLPLQGSLTEIVSRQTGENMFEDELIELAQFELTPSN